MNEVTCFAQYDPEANAATLAFSTPSRGGGVTLPIEGPSGLVGTVRLNADGEFGYLEVLGANRAVAQFVPRLTPPSAGVRDYQRGAFDVPISKADDGGSVTITLCSDSPPAPEHSVQVTARNSSEVVASVHRHESGLLHSLSLYNHGNLIRRFDDGDPSGE